MAQLVVACDLGTGGAKTALFRPDGSCVAESVVPYQTLYPGPAFHEQKPSDWWQSIEKSIRTIVLQPGIDPSEIGAISISGHSLGCVPLSAEGEVLLEAVPIWSDGRAENEAGEFFQRLPAEEWYQ